MPTEQPKEEPSDLTLVLTESSKAIDELVLALVQRGEAMDEMAKMLIKLRNHFPTWHGCRHEITDLLIKYGYEKEES